MCVCVGEGWGGSATVTLADRDQGLWREVPLSAWSPQGVDVVILSVLDGGGVPARALIPYVT